MADAECICKDVNTRDCSRCVGMLLPFYNDNIDQSNGSVPYQLSVTQTDEFEFFENMNSIQECEIELDPDYNLYGNIKIDCEYQEVEDFRVTDTTKARIVCLNIRSAPKNMEQFKILMDPVLQYCPIIALTETWFNSVTAELYFLRDFSGFHVCRPSNKRGGGVSIYINSLYTATYIKDISFCHPHIETVFVKLPKGSILEDKGMIIGCVYRPPQGDVDNFNNEITNICEYFNSNNDVIYICGDTNLDFFH